MDRLRSGNDSEIIIKNKNNNQKEEY